MKTALKLALEAAYLAGFNASGEGYNGEYPFQDNNVRPEKDDGWVRGRDNRINAIKKAFAKSEQEQCGHESCDCRLYCKKQQPEQEPVTLETVYETIIQWDECGGKRSRRELARSIVSLYTTPYVATPRPQRKPLTDLKEALVEAMSIINHYGMHGWSKAAHDEGEHVKKKAEKALAAHGIKE